MFCKKCGKEIPNDSKLCPECGALQCETKFCQHCGAEIEKECVVCPKCGKQVSEIKAEQPHIVINNSNSSNNVNTNKNQISGGKGGRMCNKWVAFFLCLFLGFVGGHKFYEGRVGMAILYILTVGLFGIGVIIDLIGILLKPNPYYV